MQATWLYILMVFPASLLALTKQIPVIVTQVIRLDEYRSYIQPLHALDLEARRAIDDRKLPFS